MQIELFTGERLYFATMTWVLKLNNQRTCLVSINKKISR